jgi:uncharacterized membrane protein (UPF0127 family)
VVEVVAGFAKSHGVAVGDLLTFSNIGKARGGR